MRQILTCEMEGASCKLELFSCVTICLTCILITTGAMPSDATDPQDAKSSISSTPRELSNDLNTAEAPTINLVIGDGSSNELLKEGELYDKLHRHSYDVSVAEPSSNTPSHNPSDVELAKSTALDPQSTSNKTASDPLVVSDSRLAPQSMDHASPDEEEINQDEDDNLLDGASTNLSEKRVMKELAKMLSKGMSGATDQVNLNTLENMKKRVKQRKQVKDNRAKLFEDLLTAAISTHPERAKKGKGTKDELSSRDKPRDNPKLAAALSGLKNELEPELSSDTETVLRHLQSLSTAFVDAENTESNNQAGEDTSSLNEPLEGSSAGEGSDSGLNNESASSNDSDEKVTTTRKSLDRPLVRGFKKIKNQFIQRRKHLDQIKKLFNIELALNPKDGSLVRKSSATTSSKRKATKEHSDNDDSGNEAPIKRKPQKNKMKELLKYLKENPEILNSVMSELQDSNEQNNRSSEHSQSGSSTATNIGNSNGSAIEEDALSNPYFNNPPSSMQHYVDADDIGVGSYSTHKGTMINALDRPMAVVEPLRSQFEEHLSSLGSKSRKVATRLSEALNGDLGEKKRFRTRLNTPQVEFAQQPMSMAARSKKSAEAFLLESLRERQLMNLARLDLMLAEKHLGFNSSSSQMSKVTQRNPNVGDMDPNNVSHTSKNDHLTHQLSQQNNPQNWNNQRNQNQATRSSSISNQSQRPDEEVAHHFMAVNSDGGSISDQFTDSAPSAGYSRHDSNQQYSQAQDSDTKAQSQPNSLRRFKEWRDVSMDETNQLQVNDRMEYLNKKSHDLSTGGSAYQRGGHREHALKSTNYRQDNNGHQRHLTNNATPANTRVPYASASSDIHRQSVNSSSVNHTQMDPNHGQASDQFASDASADGQLSEAQSTQSNNDDDSASESRMIDDNRVHDLDSGAKRGIQKRSRRSDISLVKAFEGDDPNKPVDYFSSYSGQGVHHKDELSRGSKRRRNLADNDLDNIASDDDVGALWAS